jgi:hypothetical protein
MIGKFYSSLSFVFRKAGVAMSVSSPELQHDKTPSVGAEAQAMRDHARMSLSHEFTSSKFSPPKAEHGADRNDPSLAAFGHLTLVHGEQGITPAPASRPERAGGAQPQFERTAAIRTEGETGAAQPGHGKSVAESDSTPAGENKSDQPTVKQYPDGEKKSTYPNGVSVSEWPDGQSETRYPDGRDVYKWPNGDKETDYPDGKKEFNYHNGDSETIFPNGIKIYTEQTGGHSISYPDGSYQHFNDNGTLDEEGPAPGA